MYFLSQSLNGTLPLKIASKVVKGTQTATYVIIFIIVDKEIDDNAETFTENNCLHTLRDFPYFYAFTNSFSFKTMAELFFCTILVA